eukprot:7472449-Alexandrium_andersonii.AAC.1
MLGQSVSACINPSCPGSPNLHSPRRLKPPDADRSWARGRRIKRPRFLGEQGVPSVPRPSVHSEAA